MRNTNGKGAMLIGIDLLILIQRQIMSINKQTLYFNLSKIKVFIEKNTIITQENLPNKN